MLRISPVQSALHWELPAANRAHFDALLAPLAGRTDLVILPEMWTSGFTMNAAKVAEPMDGPSVDWLRATAARLGAVVTGSQVIVENDTYHNRLIWMRPDGSYAQYDKRHGFSPAGEHEVYRNGTAPLTVELQGWRIRPLICYDLRFPVWSRNVDNYDLLLYTANWPAARALHWRTLLAARAIENQAYCVGVNRVGTDGKGLAYRGDSTVIDPLGEVLWSAAQVATVTTVALDLDARRDYRERLPFWRDADPFTLK